VTLEEALTARTRGEWDMSASATSSAGLEALVTYRLNSARFSLNMLKSGFKNLLISE